MMLNNLKCYKYVNDRKDLSVSIWFIMFNCNYYYGLILCCEKVEDREVLYVSVRF